jgi:hypothetical protein
VLRALRPLRVIGRFKEVRDVVNGILGALPGVANVAVINILFLFIFAIIGVQVRHTQRLRCVAARLCRHMPTSNSGGVCEPARVGVGACRCAGAWGGSVCSAWHTRT